jgi:hypothetical protein
LDFVAEQVWFFYMPALLSGVLQYLFSVSGLLDRFIGLCITLTTPHLALLLPCVINLDNNLEKNYVWKRLNWSGISQGYQTTRVVCLLALCLCALLMMLLIECMGCAGCTLQKAAEGDILRSHTQIFIRQNSAERAHTKTHLQTVIRFCV